MTTPITTIGVSQNFLWHWQRVAQNVSPIRAFPHRGVCSSWPITAMLLLLMNDKRTLVARGVQHVPCQDCITCAFHANLSCFHLPIVVVFNCYTGIILFKWIIIIKMFVTVSHGWNFPRRVVYFVRNNQKWAGRSLKTLPETSVNKQKIIEYPLPNWILVKKKNKEKHRQEI